MAKTTLYLKDQKKKLRCWSIESHDTGIKIEHGVVGGAISSEFEEVLYGRGTRSRKQQIELMVSSKIKKRMEKGYSKSPAQAELKGGVGLNDLGLPRPMLASKFDPNKVDPSKYYKQPKLDGHRCIIHKDGDFVQAYSRNGKPIDAIEEIIQEVRKIPYNKITLDGELYIHGLALETISSLVRRRQDQTSRLTYWAYDTVRPGAIFAERIDEAFTAIASLNPEFVMATPTFFGVENVTEEMNDAKIHGYEGLILRHPESYYECGKRSKDLLKVKSRFDEEFKVVAIDQNKVGGAILLCEINGKTFGTPAPGMHHQKEYVWKNRANFIGKYVRVEYANLTKDGIPFHPVATMWRNKHDE